MPVDYKRYPANWKEISKRIREREGNKCKWCGLANGAIGHRDPGGRFWTDEEIDRMVEGDTLDYEPWRRVRIILTVAHLGTDYDDGRPGDKHDKMDVRDCNLAALCQRCHLNYDRDEHIANAKVTYARKRRAAILNTGQMELL